MIFRTIRLSAASFLHQPAGVEWQVVVLLCCEEPESKNGSKHRKVGKFGSTQAVVPEIFCHIHRKKHTYSSYMMVYTHTIPTLLGSSPRGFPHFPFHPFQVRLICSGSAVGPAGS